jgi:hypothetical protein
MMSESEDVRVRQYPESAEEEKLPRLFGDAEVGASQARRARGVAEVPVAGPSDWDVRPNG